MNSRIIFAFIVAFFLADFNVFGVEKKFSLKDIKDSCGCSVNPPKSVKVNDLSNSKPWWYKRNRQVGSASANAIKINGPSVVKGQAPGIKAGQYAPNITLTRLQDHPDLKKQSTLTDKVTLADFVGDRPVVLFFGSYTCPPFRNQMPRVNVLYDKYKDQAVFLFVYIREAHPVPVGRSAENAGRNVIGSNVFTQPKTFSQRRVLAEAACGSWKTRMPVLIDTMKNPASDVYQSWPNRLFIIDKSGKIVYCGNVGPRGTRVDEAEPALNSLLTTPEFVSKPGSIFFDGKPKLIVVNGYSTSFNWPKVLQRKLDRYFGQRIIEVKSATKGGTPIAKWMNVKNGQPLGPWIKILQPQLKDSRPTIVLAQQSLQWAYGGRHAGINDGNDKVRIKQGADVLRKYANLMLKQGADKIFIAMHIYKKSMEPQIGNERLALAELVKRQIPNVYAGPDVWIPTQKYYPLAFSSDKMHPNSIGAEIMAQLWFETILKKDGLEVPKWSKQEMSGAIKNKPEQNNRRSQFRARMLKRYDKDGDGRLSQSERAAFRRAREERRKSRQNK
jgi:thiol-disulfide isomerase/thioredoxin